MPLPVPLSSANKLKPLQRVQPLQIQSPSMINMVLNPPVMTIHHGRQSSTSSSDDNSLEGVTVMKKKAITSSRSGTSTRSLLNSKANVRPSNNEPVTFVKTFQKATASSALRNDGNLKQRPPLKAVNYEIMKKKRTSPPKDQQQGQKMQRRTSMPADMNAGYMKPTKTAALRQNTDLPIKRPTNTSSKKASSTTSSSSSDEGGKKSKARRSLSSSSSVSDKSSNDTVVSVKNGKSSSKKSSTSNKKAKTLTSDGNPPTSKLQKLKNTVNEIKRSASEKSIPRSPKASSKKRSKDDNAGVIRASKSEGKLTHVDMFKNPIESLIKFYETTQAGHIRKLENDAPVILEDRNDDTNRTSTSNSSIGHLSQISQLSAEQIQSWLSNPMSMTSMEHDLSVTEISVLDQYVTDMISFTQGALPGIQTPRQSRITDTTVEDAKDISVHDMISIIESIEKVTIKETEVVQERPTKLVSITVLEDKTPSEEDLQYGVFTEVSCAGHVKHDKSELVKPDKSKMFKQDKSKMFKQDKKSAAVLKQADPQRPIPSPRVKKKARKDQMLQQHKEIGHEALSMVLKQFKDVEEDVPDKTNNHLNNNDEDGMECLDDLCSQSRHVQQEIAQSELQQQQDHQVEVGVDHDHRDQREVGKDNRILMRLLFALRIEIRHKTKNQRLKLPFLASIWWGVCPP
jgi:hypothetical protein